MSPEKLASIHVSSHVFRHTHRTWLDSVGTPVGVPKQFLGLMFASRAFAGTVVDIIMDNGKIRHQLERFRMGETNFLPVGSLLNAKLQQSYLALTRN